MKALSGYAEWFWLMAKGWKDVENRDWPLERRINLKENPLPLRIYLHASKAKASVDEIDFICDTLHDLHPVWLDEFLKVDWSKYRGCIIGEITITGQCDVKHVDEMAEQVQMLPISSVKNASIWLFGAYGFWVRDGVLYDKPIPYRGQLGFFEVELPNGH